MRIKKNFTRKNGKVVSINVRNKNNSNRDIRQTMRNNITMRRYRLYNKINDDIREILKHKLQTNHVNQERELSNVFVVFNQEHEFIKIINNINNSGNINKSLLIGNICYIMYIANIWKSDIISNPKHGTFLREYQKNILKNIKLKRNPETKFYFLKSGSGGILLQNILEDLKEEGYNTIILQATSDNLVKYYQRFGFILFPEKIYYHEGTTYMYLHN